MKMCVAKRRKLFSEETLEMTENRRQKWPLNNSNQPGAPTWISFLKQILGKG